MLGWSSLRTAASPTCTIGEQRRILAHADAELRAHRSRSCARVILRSHRPDAARPAAGLQRCRSCKRDYFSKGPRSTGWCTSVTRSAPLARRTTRRRATTATWKRPPPRLLLRSMRASRRQQSRRGGTTRSAVRSDRTCSSAITFRRATSTQRPLLAPRRRSADSTHSDLPRAAGDPKSRCCACARPAWYLALFRCHFDRAADMFENMRFTWNMGIPWRGTLRALPPSALARDRGDVEWR